MPSWLLLLLFVIGCTLVVPVFVWGNTANWRVALRSWRFFALMLLVLAIPGIVTWLWVTAIT